MSALLLPKPVRITAQSQMQQVRRALKFCYICGESLDRKADPCIGEHIVPKSVLGPPPSNGAWRPELDVHKACDEVNKAPLDDWVKNTLDIHTTPKLQWSKPNVNSLPLEPKIIPIPNSDQVLYAFSGAQKIIEHVGVWVRGMHSVLYREPLKVQVQVFPPVPGIAGNDLNLAKQLWALGEGIITWLEKATNEDTWDGLRAWCDELEYLCYWVRPGEPDTNLWTCVWSLRHPRVLEWSATVVDPPRPWHGYYQTYEMPPARFQ